MDIQHKLIAAFRASDLDCASWDEKVLEKLSDIAIEAMTSGGYSISYSNSEWDGMYDEDC